MRTTSAKDILIDTIKTLEFMLPFGRSGEPLTQAASSLLGSEAFLKSNNVLDAKFMVSWFVPPLLLGALRFPDSGFAESFLGSLSIDKHAGLWVGLDSAFCGLLLRAFDRAFPEHPPLLVGHAFNIYPEIVKLYNCAPTNTDNATQMLHDLYGRNGSKFLARMQQSPVHLLATTAVDKIEDNVSRNFLRRCYERAGFVVTEASSSAPHILEVDSAISSSEVSVSPPIPVPAILATGWERYHDRYCRLMSDRTFQGPADVFITKEAKKLATQIKSAGFPVENPIRNYSTPNVPDALSGHRDILNVLIQRRAILRWAQVCELRRDDNPKSDKRSMFLQALGYGIGNLESYSNYFNAIGLKMENLFEPDKSGFFSEELAWLKSFRTRR